MKFKNLLAAGLALAFGWCGYSAEVYVGTTNAADDSDHGTSEAPYATIAYAVTQLGSDGGTVWVQAGTYASSTLITVSTPVKIAGLGATPADTTISGSGTASLVIKISHASASLENVTVANGYRTNASISQTGAAPGLTLTAGTVSNCVITANTGNGNWSQFANVYQTGGLIIDCVISDGRLPNVPAEWSNEHALGAYLDKTARMERCLFKDFNNADARGYIVYIKSASAVLTKCTVVNSNVKFRGGTANNYALCPGYGIYATAGTVTDCAVIGVRRAGTCYDGTSYYSAGLAPWGGTASCFSNCVTDGDAAINENCYAVATDAAFVDYANADYSPVPGGVLATQGIGYKAYSGIGFDATFGVNSYTGTKGAAFTFTASVTNSAGTLSYQWDFDGDGTYDETTSTPSATHTYELCGTYSPVLKVSDGTNEKTVTRTSLVTVGQSIVYVDAASTNPVSPYDDPTKAATSIADALVVAGEGSEIRVAAGTYESTSPIQLTKGIRVIGSTGDPKDVILKNTGSNGLNSLAVLANEDAWLANVTLTNGVCNNRPAYGSGVTIEEQGGTVSNCVIVGCKGTINQDKAGGAYVKGGLLTHCVIADCKEPTAEMMNGEYKACGALVIYSGRIENTLFKNFNSGSYGHVVWVDSKYAFLNNCTIVDSELSYYLAPGGKTYYPSAGIYCPNGTVRNCAVFGVSRAAYSTEPATNAAPWLGTAANFVNCATDGDAAINETCVLDTAANAFSDYAAGDYCPSLTGGLVDAGAEVSYGSTDLAGKSRVSATSIDIGCYEAQAWVITKDGKQGYISDGPWTFKATLDGNHVKNLDDTWRTAGPYRLTVNACTNYPSVITPLDFSKPLINNSGDGRTYAISGLDTQFATWSGYNANRVFTPTAAAAVVGKLTMPETDYQFGINASGYNCAFATCAHIDFDLADLPDGITIISDNCFADAGVHGTLDCEYLTSVGYYAFAKAEIKNFRAPALKTIGEYCFWLSGITNVSFGATGALTSIASSAFFSATNLVSITPFLPKSCTKIGRGAFQNCYKLASPLKFYGSNNTVEIGSSSSDWETFLNCWSLPSADLSESTMTFLTRQSFNNCYSLEWVKLPDNFKSFGYIAAGNQGGPFANCTNLSSVIPFIPDTVTNVAGSTFSNCPKLRGHLKMLGVIDTGASSINGAGIDSVEFGPALKSIGNNTFDGCPNLSEIKYPEGLTGVTLGTSAFKTCNALTGELDLRFLSTLGYQAFYDANNIETLRLGEGLVNVPNQSFYRMKGLRRIYWYGDKPTTIGTEIFGGCANKVVTNYVPKAYSANWQAVVTSGGTLGIIPVEWKSSSTEWIRTWIPKPGLQLFLR